MWCKNFYNDTNFFMFSKHNANREKHGQKKKKKFIDFTVCSKICTNLLDLILRKQDFALLFKVIHSFYGPLLWFL